MTTKRHISSRVGDVVYDEIITAARAERVGKSAAIQNLLLDGLRWRMLEAGVSRKFLSELADEAVELEYAKFSRALVGDTFRLEQTDDGSIPLGPDEVLLDGVVFIRRGGCK